MLFFFKKICSYIMKINDTKTVILLHLIVDITLKNKDYSNLMKNN